MTSHRQHPKHNPDTITTDEHDTVPTQHNKAGNQSPTPRNEPRPPPNPPPHTHTPPPPPPAPTHPPPAPTPPPTPRNEPRRTPESRHDRESHVGGSNQLQARRGGGTR